MLGGHDGAFRDDVWFTDDMGVTWSEVAHVGERWVPRWGHACLVRSGDNGSAIDVLGGQGAAGLRNDVWTGDAQGARWSEAAIDGIRWSPRFGHAAARLGDGSVLLVGGWDGTYKNDVWRSSGNLSQWHLVEASGPRWEARWGHAALSIQHGSRIVVAGGFTGQEWLNDVWLSEGGSAWEEAPKGGAAVGSAS